LVWRWYREGTDKTLSKSVLFLYWA